MEYCIAFYANSVISAGVLSYLDNIGLPPAIIGTFPKSAGVCALYCLGFPMTNSVTSTYKKVKTCLVSDLNTDLIIMSENSGGGFYILSKYKAVGYDDNLVKGELRDIKKVLKKMQGRIDIPLHKKVNGLKSMEALLKRTASQNVISVLSYEPQRDGEVAPVPKSWLVVPESVTAHVRLEEKNVDTVANHLHKTEDIWLPRVFLK